MTSIRFVVDESSWTPKTLSANTRDAMLESFVERLEVARERGEDVARFSEFFTEEVAYLLWSQDSPVDHDLRMRLAVGLTQTIEWDKFNEVSALDAVVDGQSTFAPSICWVHSRLCEGEVVACLPLASGGHLGPRSVVVGDIERTVWFVSSEDEHVEFFRAAAGTLTDEKAFSALCPSAFPNVAFVDGVWKGLRMFSKPFRDMRDDVLRHLSVLSDHGASCFGWSMDTSKCHASDLDVQNAFLRHNLDIAPENHETLGDAACRRERTKRYAGNEYVFSWHFKIQPYSDRIHVHEPLRVSAGRVIVGIFHRHLRLPGDR